MIINRPNYRVNSFNSLNYEVNVFKTRLQRLSGATRKNMIERAHRRAFSACRGNAAASARDSLDQELAQRGENRSEDTVRGFAQSASSGSGGPAL